MMIKRKRYIVLLMKVHAISGLSKVEQKADNERIVVQEEDFQREKKKNQ